LELSEIREVITKNKISGPAKPGQVAPCDVVVPKGNTGLEPGQTTFLQALNIATKITKGTIEILNDVQV
jgi:large subunit ribosomal protein LP0